ncbi:methyltransferase-like protein 7A [Varanus komodoensis]|uniref:Methyltransferase like 7A n=1 Tax=Varanus komodoensis TaxID=61221 RepID=A0A8D2IZ65_VARKO|nr:methyltransferase-like protein 7A [Varanus komodoensis]
MVLIPLLRGCVQLLALPVYVLSYLGLWDFLCKSAFPFFMARISKVYNRKLHKEKRQLFSNLQEFAGPSGRLTVLEIGTGSGANFQFYPPGCRVICTEPNPKFEKYLRQSVAENPHLQMEGFVAAPGEDLRPVPDGSVDVVVCTLVLCSVPSVQAVLEEVLRVLRPGGAFYFMEHVAADRSSWNYFWQQICYPTWKLLGDGCSLTRETWKDLENAKFSDLNLRHIMAPLMLSFVHPHILGYAVK